MSDLKKHQYTMESCNHCGQCKWLLPGRMDMKRTASRSGWQPLSGRIILLRFCAGIIAGIIQHVKF